MTKDDHHAYAACMDGLYELEMPDSETKDAKPKPALVAQHGSYVSGVGLLDEDRELVSTSYDGTIQIRQRGNDPSMPPRFADRLHSFWSWRMAVSRDRKYIASVSGQYWQGPKTTLPFQALNQLSSSWSRRRDEPFTNGTCSPPCSALLLIQATSTWRPVT